jgi:hypothetical protein
MSVMSLDGPKAERPIPLHYHDGEYEFFYVLRGAVQLWADDESRVLYPGDFGYAPPGTLHAYAGDGHYTKVLTMRAPGGLEKLIATAGEATEEHIFSASPGELDLGALRDAAAELDVTFV